MSTEESFCVKYCYRTGRTFKVLYFLLEVALGDGNKWINSIWVFRMVQSCMKLTIFGHPSPLPTGEKIGAISALVCSDRWLTVWESGKCRTIGGDHFSECWLNIWSCVVLLQNLFRAFSQVRICTDILQQDKVSGVVHRLPKTCLLNITLCQCICVNVIWFTPSRKLRPLLNRLSWFANACFALLHSGLLYRPKLDSKCRKYGYMLLSKV